MTKIKDLPEEIQNKIKYFILEHQIAKASKTYVRVHSYEDDGRYTYWTRLNLVSNKKG